MAQSKVYVLCRFARSSSLYLPWIDQLSLPVEIVTDPLHQWELPQDACLVVTHLHYQWEALSCLRKIMTADRVPVLILADGVLEYRNTWQNPELPDGAIFQPVFGHKLACIGAGQAGLVESWGNPGVCEVVGLPRLDQVQKLGPCQSSDASPFRVLVATANRAAFDIQQQHIVVQSVAAVRDWASEAQTSGGRPIEIEWRLSQAVAEAVGVVPVETSDRPPLTESLAGVDAVVTTPSTLQLESAFHRRPTALLDFFPNPRYVPAAWVIGSERHLEPVFNELADPPASKMAFQDYLLHDQLQCSAPATPRLLQLVESMADFGRQQAGSPRDLPSRILDPVANQHPSIGPLDLDRLYPENEWFQIRDLARLQIELTAAVNRLGQMPEELANQQDYLEQVLAKNNQLKERVRDLHARVKKLRGQLGITGPADNATKPD